MNENKKKVITTIVAIIAIIGIVVVGIVLSHKSRNGEKPYVPGNPTQTDDQSSADDPNSSDYAEPMPTYSAANYLNDKVLSAQDKQGNMLSVGVQGVDFDGLIFAPQYSNAGQNYKVGYYINYRSNNSLFLASDTEYSDIESVKGNNVFISQTYDRLKTAEYTDNNNFGVAFKLPIGPPPLPEMNVKITAVRMDTHNVLGSYTLVIAYEDEKFCFKELYNNDVTLIPEDKLRERWNVSGSNQETVDDINEGFKRQEARLKAQGNEGSGFEMLTLTPYENVDFNAISDKLIAQAKAIRDSGDFGTSDEPMELSTFVELAIQPAQKLYLTSAHDVKYVMDEFQSPVWAVTINSINPNVGAYTYYFTVENITQYMNNELAFVGMDFATKDTAEHYTNLTKEPIERYQEGYSGDEEAAEAEQE